MERNLDLKTAEIEKNLPNREDSDTYFRNKNRVIFQGWKRYIEAEEEE